MTQNGTAPPKLPPSTPEGDEALRQQRARNYLVKRAHDFTCAHGNCTRREQLLVVKDADHLTVRCPVHMDGLRPTSGQWVDSQREATS